MAAGPGSERGTEAKQDVGKYSGTDHERMDRGGNLFAAGPADAAERGGDTSQAGQRRTNPCCLSSWYVYIDHRAAAGDPVAAAGGGYPGTDAAPMLWQGNAESERI